MLLLDNFTFNREIMLELIDYQGKNLTSVVVMEEISELIEALVEYKRTEEGDVDTLSHLDEEICDVLIGAVLLKYMYNTHYEETDKEDNNYKSISDIYDVLITNLCKYSKKVSKMIRGKALNSNEMSEAANIVIKYLDIFIKSNKEIEIDDIQCFIDYKLTRTKQRISNKCF